MTSAMIAALEAVDRLDLDLEGIENRLGNRAVGNPIGHEHILAISKLLQNHNEKHSVLSVPYHLDDLLRGSRIYQEPSKPKAEPVGCQLSPSPTTPANR